MNLPETTRTREGGELKPSVFVVDDEPMVLELALAILEPEGYQVRTFRDPIVALQACQASAPPPSLVITDFAMNAMNGMELVRKLRLLNPTQKILLVSGTVDEDICSRSPVKPDRFLAKPYQAGQLTESVRELVNS